MKVGTATNIVTPLVYREGFKEQKRPTIFIVGRESPYITEGGYPEIQPVSPHITHKVIK